MDVQYIMRKAATKQMGKIWISLFLCLFVFQMSVAQTATDERNGKYAVIANQFLNNWYVQAGLDMSLQNPYGYNFSNVFPKGKSFGVHASVGRWFTPGLGLRARVNWENTLPLLKNGHQEWLAPFGRNGINREKGGYLSWGGDIQFDVHNLLCGYDAERLWNLQLYPRAGFAYNFGVSKGTPLLGFGVGNTFRLNERLRLYCDVAYQMLSSGFVGVVKDTGVGSNSNGYFDICVGVQMNLGKSTFTKVSDVKRRN